MNSANVLFLNSGKEEQESQSLLPQMDDQGLFQASSIPSMDVRVCVLLYNTRSEVFLKKLLWFSLNMWPNSKLLCSFPKAGPINIIAKSSPDINEYCFPEITIVDKMLSVWAVSFTYTAGETFVFCYRSVSPAQGSQGTTCHTSCCEVCGLWVRFKHFSHRSGQQESFCVKKS